MKLETVDKCFVISLGNGDFFQAEADSDSS